MKKINILNDKNKDLIQKKIEFIRRIHIFKDLNEKELTNLEKISKIKNFPENYQLIKEGSTGDAFFVVIEGSVKIYKTAKDNKVKVLAIIEKNDYFGEMALIDNELRSASCVTITDCTLLVISRKDFENMLKKTSELSFVIFKTFSKRLREADRQIEILSFQNVLGRLAITLLDISKRYGKKVPGGIMITKNFTHQDFADMVGTAREMVSRILNNFKINKCIKYEQEKLYIINKNKLSDWTH